MFGPPALLYVYLTYGMHWCSNVVTGEPGEGSAVLIRAATPLRGLEVMAARRGRQDARKLCSGPANVCSSFAIDGSLDGVDLLRNAAGLRIEVGKPVAPQVVLTGQRIGISKGVDTPWRFRVEVG